MALVVVSLSSFLAAFVGSEDMTSHELEVLKLAAADMTKRESASRLGITYLTVGSRFVSILRKLRFQQVTQVLLPNLKNGRSSIDSVGQGAVNEVRGQQVCQSSG
jgi:DNA-binding CsgD family transcriptional regulator